MKDESEEPQVADEAPVIKWRMSLVVALSMTVGVLLAVVIGGGILYYRQTSLMQEQILATKNELSEKSLALDEMNGEIAALSRQMYVLRDYSIARSGTASGKASKSDGKAAADAAPSAAPAADAAAPAPVVAVAQPKKPKPKPEGESCEMVGKSPAEQAATLKRCVSMMDNPKPAKRAP